MLHRACRTLGYVNAMIPSWMLACGLFTAPEALPPGPHRLWDEAAFAALSACRPTPPTRIVGRPPTWVGRARILVGQAVYRKVTVDGAPWWLGVEEPVDEAMWSRLREDADGACPSLTFTPLATPGASFVRTAKGSYVANPRTFGFRLLEGASGGMLEGCEVRGDTVRCLLDQSWTSAVFGPEGEERRGTFQPWWQRPGS